MLYFPVNNFSVMSEHLMGRLDYKQWINVVPSVRLKPVTT